MTKESLISDFTEAKLLYYEPLNLEHGIKSNVYVDVKKAYGNPKLLHKMAGLMLRGLDKDTASICVAGYGGAPLGTAMSLQSGLPLTLVRDKPKNHGAFEMADGYLPQLGEKVSVVDDFFTSGRSLLQTVATLHAIGAEVLGCHVVVARGDTTAFELPVSYLFGPEDIR
jgi:orotate phosphoribosyltransferase